MQTIVNRLHRAYGARGGQWRLGLALACACMAGTLLFCNVTFLNNDDANILYALAGYRSGTPYPTHRFINVLLGLCISGLYRVVPAVPWWTVWQICALLASLTVLFACALRLGHRAGLPLAAAMGLPALLYLTMLIYAVAWIAFTLTAGLLGTAACALVLAIDWEQDSKKERHRAAYGALALLLLCFLTRNSSGYSMLCFFGAAALYQFFKASKRLRVRMAGFFLSALAVAVGAVALNNWGVARFNPAGYSAFESARGHFIDYPHATYEEDPAFFAALGWDQTIYDLADNLCYLDPAVDAEAMEAVAAYPRASEGGLLQRIAGALRYGEAYFRGSGVSQYMLVVPVLLLFWLAVACKRRKRAGAELWIGAATAAGAFLLCGYLCDAGRFPVRIFMLIAIPTAAVELLLLLKAWGIQDGKNDKNQIEWGMLAEKAGKTARILHYAGVFFTAAALAWSLGMTQSTLLRYDKNELVEQNAAAEAYVMAHPENIYLTDVTSIENLGAFTVYPGQKPINLIDWGGTGMHSGWKDAQLAANGVSEFSGALLLQQNVYFITARDSDKLVLLDAYLKAHAGAAGYTLCDTIAGALAVYRFDASNG